MPQINSGFPLTAAQRAIYFDQLYAPDSPMYNIGGYIRLGRVDTARLQAAHRQLVTSHDAFGLRICSSSEGIVQHVSSERPASLPEVDFSTSRDAAALQWLQQRFQQCFALHDSELCLAWILKISDDEYWYGIVAHHLLIDGWGFANLARKLGQYYHGADATPSEPWACVARLDQEYTASREYSRDRQYWLKQHDQVPEPLLTPFYRKAHADKLRVASGRATARIERASYARWIALADHYGVAISQLLLGALVAYLSAAYGRQRLVLGLPVHNRKTRAHKQTIGVFTSVLPVVVTLAPDLSCSDLLRRVAASQRGAYRHQRYPIGDLMRELGVAGSGRSLYDVSFNYLKLDSRIEIAGQAAELYYLSHDHSAVPLTFTVWEYGSGQPVELHFDFNHAYFTAPEAQLLADRVVHVLEQWQQAPDMRVGALALMPAAESARIAAAGDRTGLEAASGSCIHELFETQAARKPEAIAVVDERRAVTYSELNRLANRLARDLIRRGVGPDTLVGLCFGRSWEVMLGVLGVLKAGGAYVPLDPTYPQQRLDYMLEDSAVRLVLTTSDLAHSLPVLRREGVLALDPEFTAAPQSDASCLNVDTASVGLTPAHLAYVIYTSGSTGRPRGVMLEHAGLVNLAVFQTKEYDIDSNSRVLQFSSISFDAMTWDWVRALTRGASLYICPEECRQSGARLSRYLLDQHITHALLLPAALAHLDVEGEYELRSLIVGGEACEERLAWGWAAKCALFNAYGPTESTVVVSQSRVLTAQPVTIGGPLPNVGLHVLNADGKTVPIGVPGELAVTGIGLARGYLNRPELTAERFQQLGGQRRYRTGDLVRWRTDGELEFLGRSDDQIKLRGLRIELGEIESILTGCEGVSGAVVVVRGEADAKRLIAYVATPTVREGDRSRDTLFANLKDALRRRLPEYMIPAAFVALDRLPLNANGKIDRRALPEPEPQARSEQALPRSVSEQRIASLWKELLKIEPPGLDTGFFELGGHSLLASRLAGALSEQFGKEVTLRSIFDHQTIRSQAAYVEQEGSSHSMIPSAPRDSLLALSFAQQRLWFIDRLEGSSVQYNMPAALQLTGSLDKAALQRALDELVARHEVLRTVYIDVDGTPLQAVRPPAAVPIEHIDLTHQCAAECLQSLRVLRRDEAARAFDLSQDLMLRCVLIRLAPQQHALLLTLHHIACDGWSIAVLVREIAELYSAGAQLAPLPIQYADYAAWQRTRAQTETLARGLAYWREQLAGVPAVHSLPLDYPRPGRQRFEGARVEHWIDAATLASLKALGRRHEASLFMVLQAAFAVLLSRWSGETDIVVGTPIAGRTHKDVEPLIGLFVNMLVLRTCLTDNPPFAAVLAQTKVRVLGAYEHQEIPFERLVDELNPQRTLGCSPLCQVLFSWQDAEAALTLPQLQIVPLDDESASRFVKFDLEVSAQPCADGLRLTWDFAAALFDPGMIERMARGFENLLQGILACADTPIEHLPLLGPADRQLLSKWSHNALDIPDACFHHLFEAQATRTPEQIAVRCGAHALTYSELDERANRLAHYLVARGVRPDALVALCVERSLEMVVGMLGVMKAGGAYVPLDPAHPDGRLRQVLDDSAGPLVLTQSRLLERFAALDARAVALEANAFEEYPRTAPVVAGLSPRNLVYAIYTSGSTGGPKGVLIEHRSLVNFSANLHLRGAGIGTTAGVWAFIASYAFDASLQGMTQLASGGELLIVPEATKLEPAALRALLTRHAVEVMDCTPSLLELWLSSGLDDCLPHLVIGGEAISPQFWQRLVDWQAASGKSAVNVYGPTECCVESTWVRVAGSYPVIGPPLRNASCHVLSAQRQLLPIGVAGELYIGGLGVGRGYHNRPELTAAKFIESPFDPAERWYRSGDQVRWRADGQLEFISRLDDQVKLRGFRIELGEIATQLQRHPAVVDARVLVRTGEQGPALIAYLILRAGEQLPCISEALKQHLQNHVPQYMLPSAYVVLDAFPLTPNGKLDQRALPQPESQARIYVAPDTRGERLLAQIWQRVLKCDRVGVDEDFFDLGGHSLLAMRMASEIAKEIGKPVAVRTLFEHRTLRSLASYLERQNHEHYERIAHLEHAAAATVVHRSPGRRQCPIQHVHGATIPRCAGSAGAAASVGRRAGSSRGAANSLRADR